MRRFFSALRRLIATRLVSGAMAKLSMFASNKFLLASAALL